MRETLNSSLRTEFAICIVQFNSCAVNEPLLCGLLLPARVNAITDEHTF